MNYDYYSFLDETSSKSYAKNYWMRTREITEEEIQGYMSQIITNSYNRSVAGLRAEIEAAIEDKNEPRFMMLTKIYNIMLLE